MQRDVYFLFEYSLPFSQKKEKEKTVNLNLYVINNLPKLYNIGLIQMDDTLVYFDNLVISKYFSNDQLKFYLEALFYIEI